MKLSYQFLSGVLSEFNFLTVVPHHSCVQLRLFRNQNSHTTVHTLHSVFSFQDCCINFEIVRHVKNIHCFSSKNANMQHEPNLRFCYLPFHAIVSFKALDIDFNFQKEIKTGKSQYGMQNPPSIHLKCKINTYSISIATFNEQELSLTNHKELLE